MLKIQMNLDHLMSELTSFKQLDKTHTPNNKVFKLSTWIWRHQNILFNTYLLEAQPHYNLGKHLKIYVSNMFVIWRWNEKKLWFVMIQWK